MIDGIGPRLLAAAAAALLLVGLAACSAAEPPPAAQAAQQQQAQQAGQAAGRDAPAPQPEPSSAAEQSEPAQTSEPAEPAEQSAAQPAAPAEEPAPQQQAAAPAAQAQQGQAQQTAVEPAALAAGTRIVSLFGDLTEIIYALGGGHLIVGRDASSIYPPEAESLPNLGFSQALSAEGVLALEPTIVIGNQSAGPPDVLEQVRSAGVPVVIIDSPSDFAAPALKIRAVGAALGLEQRAEALAQDVEARLAAVHAEVAADAPPAEQRLSVLFLYVRRGGLQLVAGEGSAAAAIIEAAGGIDAGSLAGVIGFAPLTPEAVVAADPEVILVMQRGLDAIGGLAGLLAVPGVAQTRAGRSGQVIAMDDLYLLSFGPRLPEALRDLAARLLELRGQ